MLVELLTDSWNWLKLEVLLCVNDAEELLRMFAFAHKRLGNIFWENQIRIQTDKLEGGNYGKID